MAVDVQIPTLGESISEGVIVRWIKQNGEAVTADEPVLELETDKATVEIPAPGAGVLTVLAKEGAIVHVGDVVARIDGAGAAAVKRPAPAAGMRPAPSPPAPSTAAGPIASAQPVATRPAPAAPPPAALPSPSSLSPAVRRLVDEHHLDAAAIRGTGRGGRLTKEDVLAHLNGAADEVATAVAAAPAVEVKAPPRPPTPYPPRPAEPRDTSGNEVRRVPMTRLRQRIAERLRQAQATAAILTTFNEADMSAVIALRARHKARFSDVHGIGLGFMSFFARACVTALQEMPLINAQIDGTDIVYNERVHLGVAVGTERGLVVPVVHNADQLSFSETEKAIARLADVARQNKLGIDELSGGTFTISNGGVYGSLLSTPILNPPQSAILGMHKIENRPVVVDDAIVIRPMMYLALSYDHRLIDGADAVRFLVMIKERIEDPSRLLLGI
jgi:2-oxoglutarate dehydrogenase E2 component (dihydrolipoamide succinyltransferase)